jgi:hypothetical protein
MYDSRTDKAHSQNGVSSRACRCDYCFPRINWNRAQENAQALADALADGVEPFTLTSAYLRGLDDAPVQYRSQSTGYTLLPTLTIQHLIGVTATVQAYEAGRTSSIVRTRPGAPTARKPRTTAGGKRRVFVSYTEPVSKAARPLSPVRKPAVRDNRSREQIIAERNAMIAALRERDAMREEDARFAAWLDSLNRLPGRV